MLFYKLNWTEIRIYTSFIEGVYTWMWAYFSQVVFRLPTTRNVWKWAFVQEQKKGLWIQGVFTTSSACGQVYDVHVELNPIFSSLTLIG